MKKIFVSSFIFIVVIISSDLALGCLFDKVRTNANNGYWYNFNYLLKDANKDIVVIGSSTAHHNYIPSILEESSNLTAINAGMDGESIFYGYTILSSMIESGNTPKIVIFDIGELDIIESPFATFTLRAALRPFKPYYNDFSCIDSLVRDMGLKERIKMQSNLYRYNSHFSTLIKTFFSGEEKSILDGYEPLYGHLDMKKTDKKIKTKVTIDKLKITYIKKLINLSRQYDFKLLFVRSPQYIDETSKETISEINRIVNKYDIDYFDTNNEKRLKDSSLYQDNFHLNHEGATVFTNIISTYLDENVL